MARGGRGGRDGSGGKGQRGGGGGGGRGGHGDAGGRGRGNNPFRGRGRGRGGGSFGSGLGYMQSVIGGGTVDSTAPDAQQSGRGQWRGRGGGGAGRGRGRGRGGALTVQSQHAVSFDYSDLAPRSRLDTGDTPDDNREDSSEEEDDDDDDDLIIEPRRGYKHVIKPHLEYDERTPPPSPGHERRMLASDPSSQEHSSRASPTPAELSRMQRITTGQVAAIIPTGPRAMHYYKPPKATLQADLPVFTPDVPRKPKKPFVRPTEDPLEDSCMGGIPRHMRRRPARFDRDDASKRFENEQRHPPAFVKAKGEWKDGKWMRSDEGGPESLMELDHEVQSSQPNVDNTLRQGLGYSSEDKAHPQSAVSENLLASLGDLNDGGDDVDKLLQAFPGSSVIKEDERHDDSLGWYNAPTDLGLTDVQEGKNTQHNSQIDVKHTEQHMPQDGQMASSAESEEEEEIILIRDDSSKDTAEQQPNGSVQEQQTAAEPVIAESREEDFFVDTTGAHGKEETQIQYHADTKLVIGEDSPAIGEQNEQDDWQSDVDSEYAQAPRETVHRSGKKARNAKKKAARRARKHNMFQEPLVAREGDSDLEWGSGGPPKARFRNAGDHAHFQEDISLDQLRLQTGAAPEEVDGEEQQLAMALANSLEKASSKGARYKSHREAMLEDYMQNALGMASSDAEGVGEERDESKADQRTELDALLRFMNGMDGQDGGRQVTLDDIALEQQLRDEEEWMTESGSSSEEADSEGERAFDDDEKRLAGDDSSSAADSSDGDEDSSDDDNGDQRQRTRAILDEEDDENDVDEDDDAFHRNFTWADEDEDFIARIDKFAQANDGILKGRNRAARNKLFKAIERGDFAMLDGGTSAGIDDLDLADDPVFGMQPAKKSKDGKKKWKENDPWAAQLQTQWEKDRAKKADNKRKRAAQRALDAENPFHNTNGKGKGANKKALKKAARVARRAERSYENGKDDDDVNMVDALFGGHGLRRENPLLRHATSIVELNSQIELFLYDATKTTLSLPPMDKRARAQVHQLANCYSLISKSRGSGNNRFPTLIKNSRSGAHVQKRRVDAILRSAGGSFGKGSRVDEKPVRKNRDHVQLPRNQEGAEVGFGADRIGADNIGHRLLMAMGWIEGSGVGATQGMSDPVGATIKTSRGGLGF